MSNQIYNNSNGSFITPLNYNVNSTHPLIPNSQDFMTYKKYVSIHSEDRDILKYPISSDFEIELPEDIVNISSLKLVEWTFPSNYNTFSVINSNITMAFSINEPYNPINKISDNLIEKIFESLTYLKNETFIVNIQEGFYNPEQMVTELTNRFNYVVTVKIIEYLNLQSINPIIDPADQNDYILAKEKLVETGGYNNFVIVYNTVNQKIWFGNVCDRFILKNELSSLKSEFSTNIFCSNLKTQLPDFSNWGLPAFIGLNRCDTESVNGTEFNETVYFSKYNDVIVPRFFYGDVFPGDNGYWLLPNPGLVDSIVFWVECPHKINLMGPAHMYMEIEGNNCIDETSPYNVSQFTLTTNQTNGIVNSAFAKIPIPTTPISQWFDKVGSEYAPYKFYNPPAERLRRLKIRIRYHNGQLVNFGLFNYSFVIEFKTQLPKILKQNFKI